MTRILGLFKLIWAFLKYIMKYTALMCKIILNIFNNAELFYKIFDNAELSSEFKDMIY